MLHYQVKLYHCYLTPSPSIVCSRTVLGSHSLSLGDEAMPVWIKSRGDDWVKGAMDSLAISRVGTSILHVSTTPSESISASTSFPCTSHHVPARLPSLVRQRFPARSKSDIDIGARHSSSGFGAEVLGVPYVSFALGY